MKRALFIFLLVFLAMQFIQTEKKSEASSKDLEIKAPISVMKVLKKSCYDCHSNETKWPWYSNVAPFSWIISQNVKNARLGVNFSIWESYTKEQKEKKLKAVFRTVYASMPLQGYLKFHKEANLSKSERKMIRDWTGVKK